MRGKRALQDFQTNHTHHFNLQYSWVACNMRANALFLSTLFLIFMWGSLDNTLYSLCLTSLLPAFSRFDDPATFFYILEVSITVINNRLEVHFKWGSLGRHFTVLLLVKYKMVVIFFRNVLLSFKITGRKNHFQCHKAKPHILHSHPYEERKMKRYRVLKTFWRPDKWGRHGMARKL